MNLYTIGFTKTTAEAFFQRLKRADVNTLIDTRLRRDGQLSGFAKMPDLEYFLKHLTSSGYRHEPLLAPTEELLRDYRKKKLSWADYEAGYRRLLMDRNVANILDAESLRNACFLCSEQKADQCHRRVAAEFFREVLGAVNVVHL